jgi:PAS domain S-box-containing protein
LRLKTKLVLGITAMVVTVVVVLSSVYVSQIVRQRIDNAFESGDFVSLEVFHSAREALEVDLGNTHLDLNDPEQVRRATEESLQTDPGLNSLFQSIVGYSPIIYDVSIADVNGVALLHSDADLIGKKLPEREDFSAVRNGNFWRKMKVVYGEPAVYEMRLPLRRNGVPFATIRVGISTVFLESTLQPKLNRALAFSAFAIILSLILAAVLSNFALRPIEVISRRLDLLTAGGTAPEGSYRGKDEVGVVTTKIDRLGQQMKDVKEVFSALKENLDQMMANLHDGVMLFTNDMRAVLVSEAVETFLGRTRENMIGCTAQEIFSDGSRLGQMVLAAIDSHQPLHKQELMALAADGQQIRVEASMDFIEEEGERIGALLTLRDAESVRRIEDEIEVSRRLAAIGRLTSGVAHEVKNPINAIVVHLEVMRSKLNTADPDTQRHMDVIGNEIRRLDRVVQTLVDFTRPMDLKLADTDLRRLVDDVYMLAAPEAERRGVHVQRELGDETLRVKVDADLVKQAILNVVINGIQAMGENGGTLDLRTLHEDADAVVEITDQGGGIPPEVKEKIFNLYFTTKKGGSGIGLPMTYRVVQLHNGSVEFDSQPGVGTTFRLRFPLTAAEREYAAGLTSSARQE